MQKLAPRTKKEKVARTALGLLIVLVSGAFGLIGSIGILVGLALAGNALFAPTKE